MQDDLGLVGREPAGRGSQKKEKELLSQFEIDRQAQAEKCRDEDEADKAKSEVKNGSENCSRMEMS